MVPELKKRAPRRTFMNKTSEGLKPVSIESTRRRPKELSFRCPECGNSELNIIHTGVRLVTELECVRDDGSTEVRRTLLDRGEDEMFYACASCEYRLENDLGNTICEDHDLVKWLQTNCTQGVR